ncbi:MAG: YebC/PmpR family DNA-binding transcriptional regulator [Spirochaetota bacterium]|nr:YebC/PmpR family DNA-binding transcriptional regulator [Spirochaetota bacterium]
MAGHSKWANIKHRKGAQDAKRGNLFSKIAKDLIIAARDGGGDPGMNVRLRATIDKARAANMPKENIERAIKRGTGELEGVTYETLSYEGYGPGGAAIIIDVTTDNKNRASIDVRKIFSKFNGNLGELGCVAWMFDTKGVMVFETENTDALIEVAMNANADDINVYDNIVEVYTLFEEYGAVSDALKQAGYIATSSEIAKIPQNKVALDAQKTISFLKLFDALEDSDDVSGVFTNADLDEETMANL